VALETLCQYLEVEIHDIPTGDDVGIELRDPLPKGEEQSPLVVETYYPRLAEIRADEEHGFIAPVLLRALVGIAGAEGYGLDLLGAHVRLDVYRENGKPGQPPARLELGIEEHLAYMASRPCLSPDAYGTVNPPLQPEVIGHPEIRLVGTHPGSAQYVAEPPFPVVCRAGRLQAGFAVHGGKLCLEKIGCRFGRLPSGLSVG